MNNAPSYRALYAGLLFFIFDLRYASPLINAPEVILASSLIPQGEPARKVSLRLLLSLPEYRRRPIALLSADFSESQVAAHRPDLDDLSNRDFHLAGLYALYSILGKVGRPGGQEILPTGRRNFKKVPLRYL